MFIIVFVLHVYSAALQLFVGEVCHSQPWQERAQAFQWTQRHFHPDAVTSNIILSSVIKGTREGDDLADDDW